MNRRETLLALAALAGAPHAAIAQQSVKVWRLGLVSAGPKPTEGERRPYGIAFVTRMRELGHEYKKDFVLEPRYAGGDYELLARLAAELVRDGVDIMIPLNSAAVRATQDAAKSIPIVFVAVHDPVGTGLIASLAHPGRNTTGVATFHGELIAKQLELLIAVAPKATRIAALANPNMPTTADFLDQLRAAAAKMHRQILTIHARTAAEIDATFRTISRQRVGGLVIVPDQLFALNAKQIASLALQQRLPTVTALREDLEKGMLLSYGDDLAASFRRAADYVDKIMKGANAGELPVEQPARFNMSINRKTATALGMKIPQEVLLRADEVIE